MEKWRGKVGRLTTYHYTITLFLWYYPFLMLWSYGNGRRTVPISLPHN